MHIFWGGCPGTKAQEITSPQRQSFVGSGLDPRKQRDGRGRELCRNVMFSPGGKTPAPGLDTAIGECELLRRDSSKEELPDLCPSKKTDKDLGSWRQRPAAPIAIGEVRSLAEG